MRYCILGGGGSFGLHVARFLLEQPETELVLSIGRDLPKPKCFTLGVGDHDSRYNYRVYHLTYQHEALVRTLHDWQPAFIINFAAQGESGTSFTQSWRYFETNCVGLSRLVESLMKDKPTWLKSFIQVGTSELYGSTIKPAHENAPIYPTSPYAISKAAFDHYLLLVSHRYNFPGMILRPSNCYGEGQQLHRIIPKAFLYGLTGRKLPLHGGGKAEKSFMHSWDLANAIYKACQYTAKPGEIFNLGPAKATSIKSVVEMIAENLGMGSVGDLCEITADRAHQDLRYWLDSSRAYKWLRWKPVVTWQDGLTRIRKWVEENLDDLRKQPVEFMMRP